MADVFAKDATLRDDRVQEMAFTGLAIGKLLCRIK